MTTAFADTSFYLALLRSDDPLHRRAIIELKINRPIVTTEFILLELGKACAPAEDHPDFLALVEAVRATVRVKVIPLDSRLMNRALRRMAERPDEDCSVTDCISFIVMEEAGIQAALTADQRFEQAGFKALLR